MGESPALREARRDHREGRVTRGRYDPSSSLRHYEKFLIRGALPFACLPTMRIHMGDSEFSPICVTLSSGERRELRLERVGEHEEVWAWLRGFESVPVMIAHRLFERNPDEWFDELHSALRDAMNREESWHGTSMLCSSHVR